MSATLDELSARMDRMEGALARITELLEAKNSPVVHEAQTARAQMAAVHGEDEVSERLSELMLQLGDPETLTSITRIVALAPKLEYAAYFAAAGPELLEDALEMTNSTIREQGLDPHEAQQRATRAAETLVSLTDRQTLDHARRLAGLLPAYMPLVEAAAQAFGQRTDHEGREQLQERIADALLQLSDPETQESLISIAALAPKLEYAAYFAAAGPELLEEVMETVQAKTAELGLETHVITHRMAQATDLLFLFTGTAQLDTLRELGTRAPTFVPVVKASSDVLGARMQVEGDDQLQSRLHTAMLELSDPETLESLVRIAALAPKLEYAAYFAAAGPELLEEVTDGVRTWASERGVEGVDDRMRAGLDALVTLSRPATLKGLADMSKILATVTETEDAAESLARMVTRVPRLERTLGQVEQVLDTIERSAEEGEIGSIEDLEKPAIAGLRLLQRATEPRTMASLETVIELAPELVAMAKPLLERQAEMNPEEISEMMQLLITPRMLELVRLLNNRTDDLYKLLDSLSVDEGTARLLRAAQQATANAASAPPKAIGLFGLLRALGNRDVQRAVGLGVTVSKELSTQLDQEAMVQTR